MRNQITGNKYFPYNSFWTIICIYLILGIYVLYISFATPFIDIDLKQQGGQWEIESLGYKDWAHKVGISTGDTILKIDNIPTKNIPNIEHSQTIREAIELSVQKPDGSMRNVQLTHKDIPSQFFMHFILPSIYFILALCVAIYLHYLKKHIPNINFLIYFILSVSLAYTSSGASARADNIGIIINSLFLIVCPALLLNFINYSYISSKSKKVFTINKIFVTLIPLFTATLCILRIVYPHIRSISSSIILILFLLLFLVSLIILIRGYIKYKSSSLKALFLGLFIPFLPFLFLFVLPELLLKQTILAPDICALFLLWIPFTIIFLQLTERLFDLIYHITRFRYYSTISLFFLSWLIIGIQLIADISLTKLFPVTLFIFISSVVFLYIKEKVDYRGRKILFSTKGNHIHKLYQTIEKIGTSHRVEQMLQMLTEEIITYLEVKEVTIITYSSETEAIESTNKQVSSPNIILLQQLKLGEVIKKDDGYVALIHKDKDYKRWLIINHPTIRLKAEEFLWLELLLTYTHSFIENIKIIEELINELHQLQQTDISEPTWLKKFVWIKVEEEKFQLAQELHDTVLQEHLHIARQLDGLMYGEDSLAIKSKLKNLHKQMVLSINNLRLYCETLKPPLLTNIGLNAALERLLLQTTHRGNFKLTTRLDRLYLEDEQLTLVIYRIVQELLNNALKHSQAETVELYLQELDTGFKLIYRDNGIGCDLSTIRHGGSMGLQGIRERIEAFNGEMIIDSNMNEGMSIQIKIIERSEALDLNINSG